MSPQTRPRSIYFARRHPDLIGDAFRLRWRRHGALGISMPRWKNVAEYVHYDPAPAPWLLGGAADVDGIGLIEYRSDEHRAAHIADTSSQAVMVADEAETFAERIGTRLVPCYETVVSDGARHDLSLFRAWLRTDGADEDSFRATALERIAALRGHSALVDIRWSMNFVIPGPAADGGLGAHMVEEFQIPDEATARVVDLATSERVPDDALAVLARRTVLYSL